MCFFLHFSHFSHSFTHTHTHTSSIVLFILVAVQSISYLRYVYVTYFMRVFLCVALALCVHLLRCAQLFVNGCFFIYVNVPKKSHCNDQYESVCHCSFPHYITHTLSLHFYFQTTKSSEIYTYCSIVT